MTPADFKTLRESLGLSAQWIADAVHVDQRTVRRWEDGAIPLRSDVVELVSRLHSQMSIAIDSELERILDEAGVETLDELDETLDEFAPREWPVVEVPRVDGDVDVAGQAERLPVGLLPPGGVLPASWYRAAAGHLRLVLDGRLHIVYAARTPPTVAQIRQLLSRALDIDGLSAEHRAEIEVLMEQAGNADAKYQRVLNTPMGQREYGRHLADLLHRYEQVVVQYRT